jgi:sugar phosphate permease
VTDSVTPRATNPLEADGLSSRFGHWRIVGLLVVVVAFGHFNRVCISVAGKQIMPDYGLSETELGKVFSAFLAIYALNMAPCGWLTDRLGARWTLAIMCFGSALCAALTGVAGWIWTHGPSLLLGLVVIRGVMGAFNSPLHPAGARMVVRSVPPSQMSFCNGLVIFAATLGTAATFEVFGGLMQRFGWQTAFVMCGAATAVLGVAWSWMAYGPAGRGTAPHPAKKEGDAPAASSRHRLDRMSLAGVTFSYACVGYFQYLFFFWIQNFLEKELKLPADQSAFYSTAITLSNGAGMLAGGVVTDRFAARMGYRSLGFVPAFGLLLGAAMLWAGLACSNYLHTLIFFGIAMAGVGVCEGPCWTAAVRLGGPRGALAGGVMNTGCNVGGTLSPVVTPWLATMMGWKPSLALAGVVAVAGAAAWLCVTLGEEASDPRPGELVLAEASTV